MITSSTKLQDILRLEQPLDHSEQLLLSYFAVFDTSISTINDIILNLKSVDKNFNADRIADHLIQKSLIIKGSYSFIHHDMLYHIKSNLMAKMLIWLFETKDGHRLLDILQKLFKRYEMKQKPVQRALCEYVNSGFLAKDVAKQIFANDVEYLIPILSDERFLSFFNNLSEPCFIAMIEMAIAVCYQSGEIVPARRIITLIQSRVFTSDQRYTDLIAQANLYAFLAEGLTPEKIEGQATIDGMLLLAIKQAYNGNFTDALKLFRQVQAVYNSTNNRALSNNLLPHSICNFIYILCCKQEGSDAALRIMQNFLKRNELNKSSNSRVAWVMAAAFLNKRGYQQELTALYQVSEGLTKQALVLIARYLGQTNLLPEEAFRDYAPQWLCLKNEYDKYVPMTDEEREKAKQAYKERTLLSSIYVKQQWEQVLESLAHNPFNTMEEAQPTDRIAYYLQNIYDDSCEVRQQSILKSGGWSAGKQLSVASFLQLQDSKLAIGDKRIREAFRQHYRFNTSYIDLKYVLPEMVNQSRLYVGRFAPYTLVTVNEEMPYLVIETTDIGFTIKSNVPLEQVDDDIIIISRGASSINFLRMKPELRPYFSQLLDLGRFPMEAKPMLTTFLESLRGKVEVHSELIKGGSTLETVKGTAAITLQMRPQGKEAYVISIFCRPLEEGRAQCEPGEGSSVIIDIQGDHRVCVERDMDREREIYYDLVNGLEEVLPPEKTFQIEAFELLPILDFVRIANAKAKEEHLEKGGEPQDAPILYNVEWPEGQKLNVRNYYSASEWTAALKKNKNGWFEMEGSVQLDENTKLNMSQLLDLISQSRNRYIRLGEGEYIALSERLRKQLDQLNILASRSRGRLQMSPFCAALLDSSVIDGELHLDVDPELLEIRKRILDSSEYKPQVPETLNATLREYQKEGYQWIARLNSWGAGALLADDMGLGKTVQTISYLLFKAEEGPALVIAPASVAPNWKTELEKFAPSLHVEILNLAQNRSLCIANAKAGDVIITTYGLLLSVKEEITSKQWTTAVLDEAHVIKNRGAKTSGVAMQLKTKYRIMLTGTPVQNHLGELWNLFQFVNPGLLGSYDDFSRRFIAPIEQAGDKARQKDLDRLVHPFMLRRTKDKVLDELPEKTEIYQTVDLSDEEMAIYEVIREKAEQMLEAEGSEKVSMNTLAEITRLRQAACSAKLIEKNWKGKSSKVEALIEALEPIVDSGDSVLVFSQFTSFLAIVTKALDKAKIPYLYIDGSVSVKDRQKLVEQFQAGECPVFIISLKAGGLGLNLTRANYVFHLDPWWNPAIEQQATDRAYRIGQHNAVTVYHFLSAGTIEEKIKRLHERKRDLADNVLDGTDMSGKLTGRELLEMLK